MISRRTFFYGIVPALSVAGIFCVMMIYFSSIYVSRSQDIALPKNIPIPQIHMLAMGDIMLSRTVAQKIRTADDPLLPFSSLAPLLQRVDFSFANLETPVTDALESGRPGSMVFNAPTAYAFGLKTFGFSVLNLANNHAADQGQSGLSQTLSTLHTLGIKTTGAGSELAEAWSPAVYEKNGMKVCFIGASYSSINDNGSLRTPSIARTDDLLHLATSIQHAKNLCHTIIVTMHAGVEYARTPNTAQQTFAHEAIDAGADMVIGAHPHWIQTIERYCPQSEKQCDTPAFIFYSLGNFIFDQNWSQDTREGLMLDIHMSLTEKITENIPLHDMKKTFVIQLRPVIIENFSTPRLARDDEVAAILAKIGEKSVFLK